MADEQSLTVRQVAQRWQCGEQVVYDLLRTGALKGFKVGSMWRVKLSAVEEYSDAKSWRPAAVEQATK